MINKIKGMLANISFTPYITAIVVCYALFVAVAAFLWLARWLGYMTYAGGLQDLTNFIQTMVATNTVNCVYSIARGLADKNNNGVPDVFEKD
ncbi:MAG: hypothetical protein KBS60_01180 [Phascolarctobacterium sp.]|nr:hypothetical protein [Candidatus Phascolarctobacterium caballi]